MNEVFGLVLINLVIPIITVFIWILVIQAVLSWLLVFNIINPYSRFVSTTTMILYRLTNPLLRPIRRILPYFGGLDFSPMILILLLYLLRDLLFLAYRESFW
ncbi:MAG: YggT family protein [Candidatus Pacebacteria bacterium]|nr:YggT family protein [Candidatus Paceibacterota bacterium]